MHIHYTKDYTLRLSKRLGADEEAKGVATELLTPKLRMDEAEGLEKVAETEVRKHQAISWLEWRLGLTQK